LHGVSSKSTPWVYPFLERGVRHGDIDARGLNTT
jgi:hypothetical protein